MISLFIPVIVLIPLLTEMAHLADFCNRISCLGCWFPSTPSFSYFLIRFVNHLSFLLSFICNCYQFWWRSCSSVAYHLYMTLTSHSWQFYLISLLSLVVLIAWYHTKWIPFVDRVLVWESGTVHIKWSSYFPLVYFCI